MIVLDKLILMMTYICAKQSLLWLSFDLEESLLMLHVYKDIVLLFMQMMQ